jgi:hypothetical protein
LKKRRLKIWRERSEAYGKEGRCRKNKEDVRKKGKVRKMEESINDKNM